MFNIFERQPRFLFDVLSLILTRTTHALIVARAAFLNFGERGPVPFAVSRRLTSREAALAQQRRRATAKGTGLASDPAVDKWLAVVYSGVY